MSCRRARRRDFMACRYNSGAYMMCCGENTCSYSKQLRIDDQREGGYHIPPCDDRHARQDRNASPAPGRTGLQYQRCQYFNTPKFICPKLICRRMVKPYYDPKMWKYYFGPYGEWHTYTSTARNPEYVQCIREWKKRSARIRKGQMTDEDGEAEALLNSYDLLRGSIEWSKEDVAKLRPIWPEAWQQTVVGRTEHRKRCPSCGDKVVRVGSTFRIPRRRDEKTWKNVEKMIADGEDLVAKFSYCMTFEEHDKTMQNLVEAIAEGKVPPP